MHFALLLCFCVLSCPMVKGGLCILGLLGSCLALPLIWWGLVLLSVCQLADFAYLYYFCACDFALFQNGVLIGAKLTGHRQGAEVVPGMGREFVPLWQVSEQV